MLKKIKQARKYVLYALVSNVLFGILYYCVFSWLSGFSLLYAYIGSLVLIFAGLWVDKYMMATISSQKLLAEIRRLNAADQVKNIRLLRWLVDSFVSFKTILFTFYLFVLIISQIVILDPFLVSAKLNDFLTANSYGIVLLIAIDMIIMQFGQDRREMESKSKALEERFKELEGAEKKQSEEIRR